MLKTLRPSNSSMTMRWATQVATTVGVLTATHCLVRRFAQQAGQYQAEYLRPSGSISTANRQPCFVAIRLKSAFVSGELVPHSRHRWSGDKLLPRLIAAVTA